MIIPIGEQLVDNYQVIEPPDDGSNAATSFAEQCFVGTALLACIEFLGSSVGKIAK